MQSFLAISIGQTRTNYPSGLNGKVGTGTKIEKKYPNVSVVVRDFEKVLEGAEGWVRRDGYVYGA
jgi:hypothetical protein